MISVPFNPLANLIVSSLVFIYSFQNLLCYNSIVAPRVEMEFVAREAIH